MPIPTRQITPTAIHIEGTPAKWAPSASPMTRMMKPMRYTPNEDDIPTSCFQIPGWTGPRRSRAPFGRDSKPGPTSGAAVPEHVRDPPLEVLVAGHDEEGVGEAGSGAGGEGGPGRPPRGRGGPAPGPAGDGGG